MAELMPDEGTRDFETYLNIFLSQIPSETSLDERRLLYRVFRNQWSGSGTVVELGPFLGGTTRAIAWGMRYNKKRQQGATLETFDKFGSYYSGERLRAFVAPMVEANLMTSALAYELCEKGDFESLFREIHKTHNYFELIRIHNAVLPDNPEDIIASEALGPIKEKQISGLFVDGCKSWASTVYVLQQALPKMKPGDLVIFQDFGWHTCFWISSMVYALRDFLTYQEYADSTYIFRVAQTPTESDILYRCPVRPEHLGASFFSEAATQLATDCRARGDLRGELIAHLHQVAALATIGEKDKALKILKSINLEHFNSFLWMIQMSLDSPTYLPGGQKIKF